MRFYSDFLDSDGKKIVDSIISPNGYDEDYFLDCSLTKDKLRALDCKNKFISLSIEDDYEEEEVAFVIYTNFDKTEFIKEQPLKYSKENAKSINELRKFLYHVNDKDECIYVRFLQCFKEGNGYGSALVDRLKEDSKNILLYSTSDARDFWEKQGFKNIYDNIYKYEG